MSLTLCPRLRLPPTRAVRYAAYAVPVAWQVSALAAAATYCARCRVQPEAAHNPLSLARTQSSAARNQRRSFDGADKNAPNHNRTHRRNRGATISAMLRQVNPRCSAGAPLGAGVPNRVTPNADLQQTSTTRLSAHVVRPSLKSTQLPPSMMPSISSITSSCSHGVEPTACAHQSAGGDGQRRAALALCHWGALHGVCASSTS